MSLKKEATKLSAACVLYCNIIILNSVVHSTYIHTVNLCVMDSLGPIIKVLIIKVS